MSGSSFKNGDVVYDLHGRAGSYVTVGNGGHLVEPIWDSGEDDGPHYGDVETWREVFQTVPEQRFNDRIAELNLEVSTQEQYLSKLQEDVSAAERELQAAQKRIKGNPQLHDLDLWLQGKVTHIVTLDYYSISIGTVDEVLVTKDREKSLRLLNLRADPKANHFYVSYAGYSDGSGSQSRCLLATSLEHARERAAEYIVQKTREHSNDGHSSLAQSAIDYGVPISDKLREAARAAREEMGKRVIASARSELERATRNLAEAEARYA